jgi:hypothetical protein
MQSDFWHPLEELLQCSRIQQRSLSDLETDLTEENISSVDLPLLGMFNSFEKKK